MAGGRHDPAAGRPLPMANSRSAAAFRWCLLGEKSSVLVSEEQLVFERGLRPRIREPLEPAPQCRRGFPGR
jgi:hypothetical protein